MRKTFVVKQRSAFGNKESLEPIASVEDYHSPKEKQRGVVCGDDGLSLSQGSNPPDFLTLIQVLDGPERSVHRLHCRCWRLSVAFQS
jgi:hypothetical protein